MNLNLLGHMKYKVWQGHVEISLDSVMVLVVRGGACMLKASFFKACNK